MPLVAAGVIPFPSPREQLQPTPDLGKEVFGQFPVPQLFGHHEIVASALITVRLICQNVSPFLIGALRGLIRSDSIPDQHPQCLNIRFP
jgi:hypothetical protein